MSTSLLVHAQDLPGILTDALAEKYNLVDYWSLTPTDLASRSDEFTVLLTNGEDTVTRQEIESLPNLECIVDFGVGFDGIDIEAARDNNVVVSNTPGVLTDDVSDFGIALMFALARQIPDATRFAAQGEWEKGDYPWTTKVSGAKVGIVGLGRIGSEIARKASAFNMEVSYTDIAAKPDVPYTFVEDLVSLAREAQFLIVAAPGGSQTSSLISADVLSALGPEGFLINIARGTVVDQDALTTAIQDGTVAGAALDVLANEPLVPEELIGRPNVIVTPHMASATTSTRARMAQLVSDNVDAWINERKLVTPVPIE